MLLDLYPQLQPAATVAPAAPGSPLATLELTRPRHTSDWFASDEEAVLLVTSLALLTP